MKPYFQGDCSPLEFGGLWIIPHKDDGSYFVVRVHSWADQIGENAAIESFGEESHELQWGWVLPPEGRRLAEALSIFGMNVEDVDSPEMAIGLSADAGGLNDELDRETVNGEMETTLRIQELLTFGERVVTAEMAEAVRSEMKDLLEAYGD